MLPGNDHYKKLPPIQHQFKTQTLFNKETKVTMMIQKIKRRNISSRGTHGGPQEFCQGVQNILGGILSSRHGN